MLWQRQGIFLKKALLYIVAVNCLTEQTLSLCPIVLSFVYYVCDISVFPKAELFQTAVAF